MQEDLKSLIYIFLHLVCHIFSYISGNMRSILAWNSMFLILLFMFTVSTLFETKGSIKFPTVALGYINKSTKYKFCQFSSLTPKVFSEHLSFIRLSGVQWMICMFLSNAMLIVSLFSSSIR